MDLQGNVLVEVAGSGQTLKRRSSSAKMMLRGFTSRCTTPAACSACARHIASERVYGLRHRITLQCTTPATCSACARIALARASRSHGHAEHQGCGIKVLTPASWSTTWACADDMSSHCLSWITQPFYFRPSVTGQYATTCIDIFTTLRRCYARTVKPSRTWRSTVAATASAGTPRSRASAGAQSRRRR